MAWKEPTMLLSKPYSSRPQATRSVTQTNLRWALRESFLSPRYSALGAISDALSEAEGAAGSEETCCFTFSDIHKDNRDNSCRRWRPEVVGDKRSGREVV